jgi:hypothetical protein
VGESNIVGIMRLSERPKPRRAVGTVGNALDKPSGGNHDRVLQDPVDPRRPPFRIGLIATLSALEQITSAFVFGVARAHYGTAGRIAVTAAFHQGR